MKHFFNQKQKNLENNKIIKSNKVNLVVIYHLGKLILATVIFAYNYYGY